MDPIRHQLIDNVRIAISTKKSQTEVLQAAVEVIDAFSEDFNWTGFYLLQDGKLVVGPYIGPETPHTVIELNAGICGAAASQKETVIVDNVNDDPRFLACSLTTRSEIVVPLLDGSTVLGEIDIDSNRPGQFTAADREMLEAAAALIVDRLKSLA